MSFWSGLAGLAGSLWSSNQNQSSANASMAFQKEVLQNRNQWAVADLKAAGLNPILAAGSTNSSAAGAQSTTENPATQATSSAVASRQIKIAERQQLNQDLIAKSQVDLNSARAAKENAQAENLAGQLSSGYYTNLSESLGASAKQSQAQIGYLESQRSMIAQNIRESSYRMSNIAAQISRMEEEKREIKARTAGHQANTQLTRINQELQRAHTSLVKEQERNQSVVRQGNLLDQELKKYSIPKAKNEASFEEKTGNKFMLRNVPGFRKYFAK